MTRLDDFTLSLLSNDEVIEVDQDPLGKAALRVAKAGDLEVWAKDMEDGRKAVGLFNRGDQREARATARWADLGVAGKQIVRDLWRQKDLGTFEGQFSAAVGRHGVVLVRLRPAQSPSSRRRTLCNPYGPGRSKLIVFGPRFTSAVRVVVSGREYFSGTSHSVTTWPEPHATPRNSSSRLFGREPPPMLRVAWIVTR